MGFAFAGGITNSVAIFMIFEEIPFVYGSGIIPKNFKTIRETVKNTIMKTFFDPQYLERYMFDKTDKLIQYLAQGSEAESRPIRTALDSMLKSPGFGQMIDRRLQEMQASPIGMLLAGFGQSPAVLKPLILSFISNSVTEMGPLIGSSLSSSDILTPHR